MQVEVDFQHLFIPFELKHVAHQAVSDDEA